jgi:hypothetical protein
MKSADLQERTKKFALRVLNLVEHLPNTIGGRVIANQLARPLWAEADELTAIFTTGRRSASRPQPSKIKPQK